MRAIPTLLLALMLALGAGAGTIGCSSHTTTTQTVEQRQNPDGTTSEVTKTEESSSDDGAHFGILSGTVHVIGQILALPFKLIGGLFSVIF
jgi:hypothetical protein